MSNPTEAKKIPLQSLLPKSEEDVMQAWGSGHEPVVSIYCPTYNHANIIEDALRGFLGQVTTFPFEIVVRDDASTDGTAQILEDYAMRYPRIIRTFFEKQNQYSVHGINYIWSGMTLARGKYVALCEGDDFWISTSKLQKQVELLEKYPEAVMSVARTDFYRDDGEELSYLESTKDIRKELLGFEEIKKCYFHTSTYVIRSQLINQVIEECIAGHTQFGDTALRTILISYGPFTFLPEVVSIYRITGDGIWTSLDREKQLKWEFEVARNLSRMLTGVHKEYQRDRLYFLSMLMLRYYIKNGRVIESFRFASLVIWYGVMKVPAYLKHKLISST